LGQIERSGPAGQLDNLGRIANRLKSAATILALHQPCDLLLDHQVAEALRDKFDKLLATEDAEGIIWIHYRLVDARQTQPRAAAFRRAERRRVTVVGATRRLPVLLEGSCQRLSQRIQ